MAQIGSVPEEVVDNVQIALAEVLGMADMYKRMQDACWVKCTATVNDGTLSAGEISCIDRCVNKYSEVHGIVGQHLQDVMKKDSENK